MVDFVNTVDVLGDDAVTSGIIDRSITEYSDNAVTSIGDYAFAYCGELTKVDIPSAYTIGRFSFDHCEKLTTVNLGVVNDIAGYAFRGCSAIIALIIRNTEQVAKVDAYSFALNSIQSGAGYVYVPFALLDTYKAATNWSSYANKIRALEDYTVDGTITGELDPSKI